MKYAMVSRSVQGLRDKPWALHKHDCRDLVNERKRGVVTQIEAVDIGAALSDIIDDEMTEMGYTTGDVSVYPCCSGKESGK